MGNPNSASWLRFTRGHVFTQPFTNDYALQSRYWQTVLNFSYGFFHNPALYYAGQRWGGRRDGIRKNAFGSRQLKVMSLMWYDNQLNDFLPFCFNTLIIRNPNPEYTVKGVTRNWDFHLDRKAAGGRRTRHQRLLFLFVVGQVFEVRRARKAALRKVNENFSPQSGAILLLPHCH